MQTPPGWGLPMGVLGMGLGSVASCMSLPALRKVPLTHDEASVATGRVVRALLLAFLKVGWQCEPVSILEGDRGPGQTGGDRPTSPASPRLSAEAASGDKAMPVAMPLSRQYNPPEHAPAGQKPHGQPEPPAKSRERAQEGRGAPAPRFGIAWALGRSQPSQPVFLGCAWPADATQPGWLPPGDIPGMAGVIFFGVSQFKAHQIMTGPFQLSSSSA